MTVMHLAGIIRKSAVQRDERQPVKVSFYHLVWIFVLCSFAGLIGETAVSFLIDGRWESRAGFVVGPFSPIYGVGAVLFTLFVNPMRGRSVAVQGVLGALVGGAFEYFAGWFFETRYGIVAWSYIDQPFNLHGHTCLGIALVWGCIGVVWTLWLLPRMVVFIDRIPGRVRMPLTAVVFALMLADTLCTLAALDCWFMRSSGMMVEGVYQEFFATYFDDAFMQARFETMSMWPVLAVQ